METLSELLALCAGKPPVSSGFPAQRDSKAEVWFFFGIVLGEIKILKQKAADALATLEHA